MLFIYLGNILSLGTSQMFLMGLENSLAMIKNNTVYFMMWGKSARGWRLLSKMELEAMFIVRSLIQQ